MAGFLYYLPGSVKCSEFLTARAGVFGDIAAGCARRGCAGPDDAMGTLLAPPVPSPPQCAYQKDAQRWEETRGGWWLGYELARRPGPDDLARPRLLGVYQAPLGDGNRWRLPTALLSDGSSPLPKVRRLKSDGSIERVVLEHYQVLYLDADRIRAVITQKEDLDEREAWDIAVRALATNYYLGEEEISALGLLTDEAMQIIAWALVDRPGWPDLRADAPEEGPQ